MQVVKYTHSCVRLQAPGGALVIDPGGFSGAAELERALTGVDAVLVTHEHPDHLDAPVLTRLLSERPDLRVWGPSPVAQLLAAEGGEAARDRVTVVRPGDDFAAGGMSVRTHGGQHALIHPSVPVVPNNAYLVDGEVLHPGDSFTVPPVPVRTLLLALHAPWSKVAEVLDHLVAVRPDTVHAIHDGLLNDRGRQVVDAHVSRVAERYGADYRPLGVGASGGD